MEAALKVAVKEGEGAKDFPSADTIRSLDRKSLKPLCQQFGIKMVGTNQELADKIIQLMNSNDSQTLSISSSPSAASTTDENNENREPSQSPSPVKAVVDLTKKPLKSILKKRKVEEDSENVQSAQDASSGQQPPWTPNRTDSFWLGKMRQRLEQKQSRSPRLEVLSKQFESLHLGKFSRPVMAASSLAADNQVTPIDETVESASRISPVASVTESAAYSRFIESLKNDAENSPKQKRLSFVELEATPLQGHRLSKVSSRQGTPMYSMNQVKRSPELEQMIKELNGIHQALAELPLQSPPSTIMNESVNSIDLNSSSSLNIEGEPKTNANLIVGPFSASASSTDLQLTCVVEGQLKTLKEEDWGKIVVRHGMRWIIQGSRWTRFLVKESEMRTRETGLPSEQQLMVLEGIDSQAKETMLNDWRDNFICRECIAVNEEKIQAYLNRIESQTTKNPLVSSTKALIGRSSPMAMKKTTPAHRTLSTPTKMKPQSPSVMRSSPSMRSSPLLKQSKVGSPRSAPMSPSQNRTQQRKPKDVCPSPLRQRPASPAVAISPRPAWNTSTVVKKSSSVASPSTVRVKPMTVKPVVRTERPASPRVVQPAAPKGSFSVATPEPPRSAVLDEQLVFQPRKALARTPQ